MGHLFCFDASCIVLSWDYSSLSLHLCVEGCTPASVDSVTQFSRRRRRLENDWVTGVGWLVGWLDGPSPFVVVSQAVSQWRALAQG